MSVSASCGAVVFARRMDNGFNFIVEDVTVRPMVIENKLPYNPLKCRKNNTTGWSKIMRVSSSAIRWTSSLRQLKAGSLTDVFEDFNNEPSAIADGIPAYWASRAVKPYVTGDGMRCVPNKEMKG